MWTKLEVLDTDERRSQEGAWHTFVLFLISKTVSLANSNCLCFLSSASIQLNTASEKLRTLIHKPVKL